MGIPVFQVSSSWFKLQQLWVPLQSEQQQQQQDGLQHRHHGKPAQRGRNMYDHPRHPLPARTGKKQQLPDTLVLYWGCFIVFVLAQRRGRFYAAFTHGRKHLGLSSRTEFKWVNQNQWVWLRSAENGRSFNGVAGLVIGEHVFSHVVFTFKSCFLNYFTSSNRFSCTVLCFYFQEFHHISFNKKLFRFLLLAYCRM